MKCKICKEEFGNEGNALLNICMYCYTAIQTKDRCRLETLRAQRIYQSDKAVDKFLKSLE